MHFSFFITFVTECYGCVSFTTAKCRQVILMLISWKLLSNLTLILLLLIWDFSPWFTQERSFRNSVSDLSHLRCDILIIWTSNNIIQCCKNQLNFFNKKLCGIHVTQQVMFLLVRCLSEMFLLAVNTCGIKKKRPKGEALIL